MPVKISPIKILSDLGYEMVDIETDEDYLSALMESIVSLQGVGASGRERADILQEELIRVRKERKKAAPSAGMKATKKTISPSKFFDKKEKKPDAEGRGGAIIKIGNSVTSIVETLKEEQKQDKKQQSFLQKMAERFKRRKKENKLEFKVFDGLKKTATKLLAPMKNAWNEFLGFIGKVILGRVLFKILEWMGDKDNQGKLKSIIKFFEDWWPAMLAGYLLFGNSLTSMVTGMLITMGKWLAPMLLAIGKLMLNPLVAAAVLAGGTALYLSTKKNKTDQNVDQSVEDVGEDETVNQLKEEKEDKNVLERMGGFVTGEGQERDEQIQRVETGTEKRYGFFGELDRPAQFNKGGTVPGSGNTDTVPAMLTPGEFVMSKGAVQKYGVDTLEGLNAAAGGTNRPTLMRQYNEGGMSTNITTEEIVAATGPSLQMFMEQQNAAVDENPEAFNGIKLKMDRDGKMPNFGEFIMNQGESEFNKGLEMLQNNESVEPEVKEALVKKALFIRRQTLENPNFKADVAFDINKDIPGTAANRLFLKAQADTSSPAALAGLSARDRALQMNRMGMSGGGLVQAFQGGGRVQMGRSAAKNRANITPRKTATVITPSEKKKVTVAYQEEKQSMENNSNAEKSSQEIPQFDVTLGRSSKKIKVLGISV